MARRRLVRNTSAGASNEKKAQPTPEDESNEVTSDQNTPKRRSRRNVATSENAQEQEDSSVQEEAKQKEKKETPTPVRSTRATRRSQVIATPPEEEEEEEEAEVAEKTSKVAEVKKQVTVKSTRQSRRTNAKSTAQEEDSKAHDEVQELGAPSEDKLQTGTRSGRLACRDNTNDATAKTKEKKDEAGEIEEITSDDKQQTSVTKTIRQSPRAKFSETPLDEKEESSPVSNQQKKTIGFNCKTEVDVAEIKDEQGKVQESAGNVEEIKSEGQEEETSTKVTGEETPTKVTRRTNRGKANVPAEGETQAQNKTNTVQMDSLENKEKSSPSMRSPRQTRRLNTKSSKSPAANTNKEVKPLGDNSSPEVEETNQQRLIKGRGKRQKQSLSVRKDDLKDSIPMEVTDDEDTEIKQEPMECDTSKEESSDDCHNHEGMEDVSAIKKEDSDVSNVAESCSYQKKGKNKASNVSLPDKSCKEEQESTKKVAEAFPDEDLAATETVESSDVKTESKVGKATLLENNEEKKECGKDTSLEIEKKEECGKVALCENIEKEECERAISPENKEKKEDFGKDISLENNEKKVEFGDATLLENNEKKEDSTKKSPEEDNVEESYYDNDDFLLMDEELDYEYQNEDDTENSFTNENQKKASEQSVTEAPGSVDLETEITSEGRDEKEAEESSGKEETASANNKEVEELDYEISEEEDNESLAPDELVIMEEDPEYMSIYVDEANDKNEVISEKSSKGEKSSRSNQSRDSKEKEKKGDRKKDSRKKEDSRRSRSRDREKRSKRERSRDRDRRERSRDKDRRERSRDRDRRERSRDRDRRERSRERDRRERSRDKDRRSRSRDKDRRSRSRDKDRRSRSRDKDRRSRSHDKDRRSWSHEGEKKELSCDKERKEDSHKLSNIPSEVLRIGDVKTKDSENLKKFSKVCLLANPYYKQQLKYFEKMRNVRVEYSEQLSSDTLNKAMQLYRRNYGRNTLYIVISGVYTVTKFKTSKSCKNCRNPLRIVTEPSQVSQVDELVQAADTMCMSVQKELSSDEMITMVPPLPAHLADADHHSPHEMLHNACIGLKLYGYTGTLDDLESSYNRFCKTWIETACKRINKWGDESCFRSYAKTVGVHMFRSIQKPILFQNAMNDWSRALKDFIVSSLDLNRHIRSGSQKENLGADKHTSSSKKTKTEEQSATDGKFEKVAVIGNTDYTKRLQELTKDLNVVHLNENIDFDEDGIAILKRLQEKCTSRTLWIILSGVSEVAEPIDDGPPKCKVLNCKDPIPTYVTKNDKLGDEEYRGMSVEKMVETSVNIAFDFAISASGKLKDDCALFLAPIMPLRGIWAGHATSHSHDVLHQMYKCSPNVPHFVGNSSMWINSAETLENEWLGKIKESLTEDSIPYTLLDKYKNNKPPVFAFIEDATLPEVKEVQEQWAELMSQIIRYYLTVTSNAEQGASDLQQVKKAASATPVLPSPYHQEPVPLSSFSTQDPMLMPGPASVMPPVAQGGMIPPYMAGPQPAYSSGVQGVVPQIPNWLPNNSSAPPMVYGPQLGVPGVPVVEAAPQILPAISVLPVTSDTQSANSGCTIQAAPKLNATMKGHLIVENMETKLNETQVRSLCQEFGEIEDLKWPQNDKAARKFLMIHYSHRRHAERAQRILNYLKVFGELAKVKLIGSNASEEEINLKGEDMELLMTIHNALDQIRKGSKVDRGENRIGQTPQYITQPADHMNYAPTVEMNRHENISMQAPQYVTQPADVMNYTPVMDRAENMSMQAPHYLSQPADQMNFAHPANTYQQLPLQNAAVPVANMAYAAPQNYIIPQGALEPPKLIEPPVPQVQPELTHTVIVKDFPQLVPLQDINNMFVELGAVSKGVLIASALHFTFKEDPSFLRALSGFRFYDKFISIEVKGSNKNTQLSSSEKKKAAAKYKEPVLKVMLIIAAALKENIDKEMNVYTFKTRACRYSDGCKEKDLCHKFHSMSDRRRCPVVFRYSDEMCPNVEFAGSCENKDSCSFAHSAVEILFHSNNFRMSPCPGSKSRKGCNKVRRVCSDFHEGKPDMLFNDNSRNLFVEGLHKTLMYLTEAIKNLFLLRDLQCLRILLITPTPELAELYFSCVTDLAKTCNQKVCKLIGDTVEDGASVLIASADAFRTMLNQNKGKKLDFSRLKLVILDDGEKVFSNMTKNVTSTLKELGRLGTTDVKFVVTLEKVTRESIAFVEKKLCPLQSFKPITDDSDVWRKESHHSTSSSGSYKNDLLEKEEKKGIKTAKNTESISSSLKDREIEHRSSQKEREIERRSSQKEREIERRSQKERKVERKSSKERDRVRKSSSKERETSAKSKSRRDGDSNSSRESRNSRTSSRDNDSSLQVENREKMVSALKEDLEKAEKTLKNEVDKELELYIQSPEFHPEYEAKYSVFMEQYKIQYPNKSDIEHSNKLWQAFWQELVTYMLKEDYNSRKQALEKEYQNKKEKLLQRFQEQDKQKEKLKDSSKRTSSSLEQISSAYSKYSRTDRTPDVSARRSEQNQQYQKTNEKERNYMQGTKQNPGIMHNPPATAGSSDRPLKISDGNGSTFSVDEAVALFFEISPALGILGPATELLCKKMASTWCNSTEFCKLFTDEDNKLVMQRLANKAKELGGVVELGALSLKLRLVSLYATTILRYASSTLAEAKSRSSISDKYLGLDIEAIARATYNRDPTSIVQNIKNLLMSKGIVNASEEQVTEIFVAVTSAHFGMACKKPAEASVPDRMSLIREAPEYDQYGNSNKYRCQDTKSFAWQNTRSDLDQDMKRSDQWKSGVIDSHSRNYEFGNASANAFMNNTGTWRSDSNRGSGFSNDQSVYGSSNFAGVSGLGSSNFAGVSAQGSSNFAGVSGQGSSNFAGVSAQGSSNFAGVSGQGSSNFAGVSAQGSSNSTGANSGFSNPNYSSQNSSDSRAQFYDYGHQKSVETYNYSHRASVKSYDYGHGNSSTQGNQSGNRNSDSSGGMSMLEFLSQM